MVGERVVCGGVKLETFLERQSVPVLQNQLFDSERAARSAARGALRLRMCRDCGFTRNDQFDDALIRYSPEYENDQTVSPLFRQYVERLVERIAGRVRSDSLTVVEIGCGQGAFLSHLLPRLDRTPRTAIGFDPAYRGPEVGPSGERFFREVFGDTSFAFEGPALVISRHVIEHVPDPVGFLRDIRAALRADDPAWLFVETPCLEWILKNNVVQDFFYEHCNYWTASSLARAVSVAGFTTTNVDHVFGGQYLWLEARSDPPRTETAVSAPVALADSYRRSEPRIIDAWTQLAESRAAYGGMAIWGAGAKGVTMANMIDPDRARIACLIDINPRKQDMYVPLTGHRVLGIAEAVEAGVAAALIMNPNYTSEMAAMVGAAGISLDLTDETMIHS